MYKNSNFILFYYKFLIYLNIFLTQKIVVILFYFLNIILLLNKIN